METTRDALDVTAAAALAVLRRVGPAQVLPAAGDDELLALVRSAEDLGRIADALRVVLAGEVAARSERTLGAGGLAHRRGCGSTAELLKRVARIAAVTARARVRLGEHVRPPWLGDPVWRPATASPVRHAHALKQRLRT